MTINKTYKNKEILAKERKVNPEEAVRKDVKVLSRKRRNYLVQKIKQKKFEIINLNLNQMKKKKIIIFNKKINLSLSKTKIKMILSNKYF